MYDLKPRFKGSTLISTMVGLSLGMVSILAMLALMKTLTKTNVNVSIASKSNGAIASGILAAQLRVQTAGYGIESTTASCLGSSDGPSGAANTDFIIASGASLTNTTLSGTLSSIGAAGTAAAMGNAIVWHFNDGTSQCEGLLAVNGGLQQIGPVACTDATSWNSLAWSTTSSFIPSSAITSYPADPYDTNNAFSQSNFFKAAKSTSCAPFGVSTGIATLQVRLGVNNSFSGSSNIANICLPNICK